MTTLTHEARRRLKAIEEFSELGSGFNIAMQDLDIRGAGNLLGGEQSGFIADIGFETYQKILNEAMFELRESGMTDETIYEEKPSDQHTLSSLKSHVSDFQIDTDLEIMFPDEYVSNISERIKLYKELNEVTEEDGLSAFEKKMADRFGPLRHLPVPFSDIVRLKWIAVKLGLKRFC